MKMISYAQNQEDVRLRRAFPEAHQGLYVDVGAADPVGHSVTKYFYEKGWRGINVEPHPLFFAAICGDRERDVNLNVALSNSAGTRLFYEASSPWGLGQSTFSAQVAEEQKRGGLEFVERSLVTTTLAAVCARHVDRPIDFLKVDVEGHEREVLEGGDWGRWRPRVVVVEATEPNTPRRCSDAWDHLLLAANYQFVVFDGLNCYYVRDEDRHLAEALSVPPNVFDEYVPYEHYRRVSGLEAALAEAEGALDDLRGKVGALAELGPLSTRLARVVNRLEACLPRVARGWRRFWRSGRRREAAGPASAAPGEPGGEVEAHVGANGHA
jgi:FkbM family methyltransferase